MSDPSTSDPLTPDEEKELLEFAVILEQACRDRQPAPSKPDANHARPEFCRALDELYRGYYVIKQFRELKSSVCSNFPDRSVSPDHQKPPLPDLPQWKGYVVRRELGRGTGGIVYEAEQIGSEGLVALKQLSNEGVRTRVEIEAIERLDHPNIVKSGGKFQGDGKTILVLEYVDGIDLRKYLEGHCKDGASTIPFCDIARLFEILAAAVAFAHARNVLHRDLKPSNIILGGSPELPLHQRVPKITDFGFAKLLEPNATRVTASSRGQPGTPAYMSPEQVRGESEQVKPQTDIYALGVIMYEFLTGRLPFNAETFPRLAYDIQFMDPKKPRALRPEIPRELETICLKCLEKDPRHRYAEAANIKGIRCSDDSELSLADDLRRFLDGTAILAKPRPWHRTALHFARVRSRALAIAGLMLFAVLAFFGVLGAWRANTNARMAQGKARTLFDKKLTQVDHETLLHADSAEKLYANLQTGKDLADEYLHDYPEDVAANTFMANTYRLMACIEFLHKEKKVGLDHLNRALVLWQKLTKENPDEQLFQDGLTGTYHDIAALNYGQHDYDSALQAQKEAVAINQDLAVRLGDEHFSALTFDLRRIGLLLQLKGDLTGANIAYMQALKAARQYVDAKPAAKGRQGAIVGVLCEQGEVLASLNLPEKAAEAFEESLSIFDKSDDSEETAAKPSPSVHGLADLLEIYSPIHLMAAKIATFYHFRVKHHPSDNSLKRNEARGLYYEAILLFWGRDLDETSRIKRALEAAEAATTLYDMLRTAEPRNVVYALEEFELFTGMSAQLNERESLINYTPWLNSAQKIYDSVILGRVEPTKAKTIFFTYFTLRAEKLRRKENYEEALRFIQMARILKPKDEDAAKLLGGIVVQARFKLKTLIEARKYLKAMELGKSWLAIDGVPGEAIFDAACAYSMASTVQGISKEEAEQRGKFSVELLKRAFDVGLGKDDLSALSSNVSGNGIKNLDADPHLNPIRSRSDYQEWRFSLGKSK